MGVVTQHDAGVWISLSLVDPGVFYFFGVDMMKDNVVSLDAYRHLKEEQEYDALKLAVDNIIEELGPEINNGYFITDLPKGTFEYATSVNDVSPKVRQQQQYIFCIDVLEHVASTLLEADDLELSNQADNLMTRVMSKLRFLCKEENNEV